MSFIAWFGPVSFARLWYIPHLFGSGTASAQFLAKPSSISVNASSSNIHRCINIEVTQTSLVTETSSVTQGLRLRKDWGYTNICCYPNMYRYTNVRVTQTLGSYGHWDYTRSSEDMAGKCLRILHSSSRSSLIPEARCPLRVSTILSCLQQQCAGMLVSILVGTLQDASVRTNWEIWPSLVISTFNNLVRVAIAKQVLHQVASSALEWFLKLLRAGQQYERSFRTSITTSVDFPWLEPLYSISRLQWISD
jgi:hypothetical protein